MDSWKAKDLKLVAVTKYYDDAWRFERYIVALEERGMYKNINPEAHESIISFESYRNQDMSIYDVDTTATLISETFFENYGDIKRKINIANIFKEKNGKKPEFISVAGISRALENIVNPGPVFSDEDSAWLGLEKAKVKIKK